MRSLLFLGVIAFAPLCIAQELEDPGEPAAKQEVVEEQPQIPPQIIIDRPLQVNEHHSLRHEGISISQLAKGKAILRVYPKGKVVVFDGMSALDRRWNVMLFPKFVGKYNLVFVLHVGTEMYFVETEFEVIDEKTPPPPSSSDVPDPGNPG